MAAAPQLFQLQPYSPPPWAAKLGLVPTQRYRLALLPTPIHPWPAPGVPPGCELHIKRDDLTGMQLSGNKVRKLEFLLAEALEKGHDSVITIGGIQSNHARATAVAARYLGLDCHLVLRNSRHLADADPGLVGNLLVERLVGAHVWQVTKEEYGRFGGAALGERLAEKLRSERGLNPFVIPVGGSSSMGCWGYVEMMHELEQQIAGQGFTDIAMACGSGGTTAGIALGNHLSGLGLRVHAYGVCDDEPYFYEFVDGLLAGMGAGREVVGADAAGMFRAVQAKGAGYALSREDELALVADVAAATGIILDPVYTGKAVHGLVSEMRAAPEQWRGRKVLFIHTGGLLGMYDKAAQLQPLVEESRRAQRLTVTMQAALSSKTCVAARPVQARAAARRTSAKRAAPVQAKYGEDSRYFDLSDLENSVGSWDMYGQEDKNRYNGLQSQFFENAAAGLTRREYLLGLVSVGAAGILVWGAKGSKDVKLPITTGPQQPAQALAALQLAAAAPAWADGGDFTLRSTPGTEALEDEYFETVPQGLAASDSSTAPRLGSLLEGPNGKKIQQCTRKCVPTCIRGGQGSPGLGPMSMRKEIVVFKDGYRSRSYCLSECTQVCALSINPPPAKAAEPAK
ncbi:pyridoxal phosphate [Micractinium conductrix]|uniref:Pyridoxal phosphate n=1 Tax=Micractinium conductrix TaxID=554055 RepID=A0A2P6V4H3_9CHLO|nr:pyridoxal phosphate [Micractinium conductrix]|eukprot:PSC68993.1 pyridoxal phosphate [Micractinium conductrix]